MVSVLEILLDLTRNSGTEAYDIAILDGLELVHSCFRAYMMDFISHYDVKELSCMLVERFITLHSDICIDASPFLKLIHPSLLMDYLCYQ